MRIVDRGAKPRLPICFAAIVLSSIAGLAILEEWIIACLDKRGFIASVRPGLALQMSRDGTSVTPSEMMGAALAGYPQRGGAGAVSFAAQGRLAAAAGRFSAGIGAIASVVASGSYLNDSHFEMSAQRTKRFRHPVNLCRVM